MAKTNSGWEEVQIQPKLNKADLLTSGATPSNPNDAIDDSDFDFGGEDTTVDVTTTPTVKKVAPAPVDADDTDYEDELDGILGDNSNDDDDASNVQSDSEDEDTDDAAAVTTRKDDTKKPSRAQQRIQQLSKQVKTIAQTVSQRKDAEFLEREAQHLETIQQLQYQLATQTKDLAGISLSAADRNIQQAKIKLRNAKENMDYDAEMEALDELTDAKAAKVRAEELAKKAPKDEIEAPRAVDRSVLMSTRKRDEWLRVNQRLVAYPEIRNLVGVIATGVQNEGYLPSDDDYYTEVNNRVNKRLENAGITERVQHYLDYGFGDDSSVDYDVEDTITTTTQQQPPVLPKKQAVNPMQAQQVKATPTKKNVGTKARLSAEEVAQARMLGVDPQALLRQKAFAKQKEQANETRNGWNSVYIPTRGAK